MKIEIKEINKDSLNPASDVFVNAFNSVGEKWNFETAWAHLNAIFVPQYFFGEYQNDEMIGLLNTKIDYLTDHKEFCIDILAVLPEFQGIYVGKALLDRAELLSKKKGINTIWLQASTKLPSYNFYKKNTFSDPHWAAV